MISGNPAVLPAGPGELSLWPASDIPVGNPVLLSLETSFSPGTLNVINQMMLYGKEV
jgi:hypothetical protein